MATARWGVMSTADIGVAKVIPDTVQGELMSLANLNDTPLLTRGRG
ncbi:MAG: hypothetical protein ACOC1U_01240 [Spirochaetota bacterium]